MSFYGMRVRLAGGSRNTFISTRADLAKKEGGGSQKNEVGDAAYFVHFTLRKLLQITGRAGFHGTSLHFKV